MSLRRYNMVLSLYLTTRGFAFTLFEGPLSPVDWGIIERRGLLKNFRCLKAIRPLIERFRPDALVLQDTSANGTRRTRRIHNLNQEVQQFAGTAGLPVAVFTRAQVRTYFESFGGSTKHGIAEAIAKHVPVFERYLPPARKPWMSEDSRMGLFDAAALSLTFFHSNASKSDDLP